VYCIFYLQPLHVDGGFCGPEQQPILPDPPMSFSELIISCEAFSKVYRLQNGLTSSLSPDFKMWVGPVNLLLVGYFGSLFAGLYWIINRSWSHAGTTRTQRAAFILLGLFSLTLAWYNIGAFIIEDYAERHSADVSKRPTENRSDSDCIPAPKSKIQVRKSAKLNVFVVIDSFAHTDKSPRRHSNGFGPPVFSPLCPP
jgi:hypothetical protein